MMKYILKHLSILIIYGFIACVFLYPLPVHLSDGLLDAQSGDPLMQIWVIHWNIHKLTSSLNHYFDANIFYPYSNTFAYHDHMFGLGLLGLPFYALSQNPIFTYNALLMLSIILSAYGMYLLSKDLTQNGYAAFFAGIIFGFLPYRFAHLDHLNLLSIQWFPLCLLFLTHYFFLKRRTIPKVVITISLFWGFYLLQVLTSFNYLFMLTYAIGIFLVTTLFFQWYTSFGIRAFRSKREIAIFVAGGFFVGVILLPFALPYLQANRELGFQRTLQEAESLSARVQDYAVAPEDNLLYGKITQDFKSPTSPFPREQILFGGILPVILALMGISGILRRKLKLTFLTNSSRIHILRLSYTVLLVVAGILSLGPSITLAGKTLPLPYLWLYKYVPGFNAMRVPARFGILVFFAVAILAALGVAQLCEYLQRYRWYTRLTLKQFLFAGLIIGATLLEYFSPPKTLTFYPGTAESIPAVYRWLAQQPEDIRAIELPLDSSRANFEYTYYSGFHHKRIVNGRSAFIPNGTQHIYGVMSSFPSQNSLNLLKSLGIHYILVHTHRFPLPEPETLPEDLHIVQTFGTDVVLSVAKTPDIWQTSTNFSPHVLQLKAKIPSQLRPNEPATIGLTIQTDSDFFCPLPYERAIIEFAWSTSAGNQHTETREIQLPLMFEENTPMTVQLQITPPSHNEVYNVAISTKNPAFVECQETKKINVSSDIPDSRRPGQLRAEFLQVTMPEIWKAGKPLPVTVTVKNTGDTIWKARVNDRKHPAGEVHLAVADWQEIMSQTSLKDSHPQLFVSRGFLPYDVAPGEEVNITTDIRTPSVSGEYLICLNMVSELIQWFSIQELTKHILLK